MTAVPDIQRCLREKPVGANLKPRILVRCSVYRMQCMHCMRVRMHHSQCICTLVMCIRTVWAVFIVYIYICTRTVCVYIYTRTVCVYIYIHVLYVCIILYLRTFVYVFMCSSNVVCQRLYHQLQLTQILCGLLTNFQASWPVCSRINCQLAKASVAETS